MYKLHVKQDDLAKYCDVSFLYEMMSNVGYYFRVSELVLVPTTMQMKGITDINIKYSNGDIYDFVAYIQVNLCKFNH